MNESRGNPAWVELGDRCYVSRYEPYDVSCGVVVGGDGVLVIDTRASLDEGHELARDVRALTSVPIRAVVNTHAHVDHTFGNGAFPGCPIVAHESVPVALAGETGVGPPAETLPTGTVPTGMPVTETPATGILPTETLSSVWSADLGDRLVEVVYAGRGHTDGDVVIRIPDADVVFAGDLVESSGPPAFGDDSYPLEWPSTLDFVVGLLNPTSTIAPGHGPPVDRDFVQTQRGEIVDVAEQIRGLATSGVAVDDALARGDWPYDAEHLRAAIRRGYATLGT